MHTTSVITRRLPIVVTLLAAALMVAACGSSSSTKSTSASAGATGAAGATGPGGADRAKIEACLKSKGVTLPTRPAGAGGAAGAGGPTGAAGAPGGAPPAGGAPYGGAGGAGGAGGGRGLFGSSGATDPSGASGPSGAAGAAGHRGFRGGGAFNNPKTQAALKACGVNFGAGRRGGQASAAFTAYETKYKAAVNSYVKCIDAHGYTMPKPNFTRGRGQSVFPASIAKNAKFVTASKSCTLSLPKPPSFRGAGGYPGAPGGGAPPAGGTATTSTG